MKKKVLALLMAATMAFAMPVTAFADDTNVTYGSEELKNHTFKAYQIFSGTFTKTTDENGNTTEILSDIKWAENVGTEAQTAIKNALKVTSDKMDDILTALQGLTQTQANDLAKVIAGQTAYLGDGITVSEDMAKVDNGYYIIIDTTESISAEDTRNFTLLQTSDGTLEIKDKHDTVSVEKKIKDINDSTETNYSAWQDSADYDVNDEIPFELIGTVADSSYDYYSTYVYEFHDVQSEGLTLKKDTIKVYLSTVPNDTTDDVELSGYTVETNCTDGCTFEVKFENLKDVVKSVNSNTQIIVTYTSELNEKAVIGSEGNPNDVYLKYSNSPTDNGIGETPKDRVIAFTYELTVNKTDENDKELAGAGFALYKLNADAAETDSEGYVDETTKKQYAYGGVVYDLVGEVKTAGTATTFGWQRIDDGKYLLVETDTPAGYNSIDPLAFEVTAAHDLKSDNSTSLTVSVTGLTMKEDSSAASGHLVTDVENRSGSLLPSTGGIGTTIFYVVGGILVVGAGVLLFTKRRVEK